jgi:hypothetical protein
MNESEIRLEVLKLAHANGSPIEAVIERAKVYEHWVSGQQVDKVVTGGTLTLPGKKGPTTPKGAG